MASVVIPNTTASPYRTTVSIYVRWANGAVTRSSGTMVGANDVLTSAHTVWNPARGNAVWISVVPAQNGRDTPYGIISAGRWNYYQISYGANGSISAAQSAWDLAVIGLSQNIGNVTGWLNMKPNVTGAQARGVFAYPAVNAVDFQNLRMVYTYATVGTNGTATLNTTPMGLGAGNDGAGVWVAQGGTLYVTGVVSTSTAGAFLDTTRLNTVSQWMYANNTFVTSNVTEHFNLSTIRGPGTKTGTVKDSTQEVDRYAFNLAGGSNVYFSLSGLAGGQDVDLYLYDLYGRQIDSSTNGGAYGELVSDYLPAGIYYVEVAQFSGTTSTYTLSYGVGQAPGNLTASLTNPKAGKVGGLLASG